MNEINDDIGMTVPLGTSYVRTMRGKYDGYHVRLGGFRRSEAAASVWRTITDGA